VSQKRPLRYDLPKAAPEPLRRVQVFVNTTDGHERELLADWLADEGVRPGPKALAAAREVREALRELLMASNDRRSPSAEALETLDRAAARSRLTVRFASGGELVPLAKGVDGAIGRVLAIAFAAIDDGSWGRLKACRNCRWAFYDYSRNRSASWCSMQLCGNRLKTKAYRRRRSARAG
jgi:predicted RNA-binding Zn ribbon-like protein